MNRTDELRAMLKGKTWRDFTTSDREYLCLNGVEFKAGVALHMNSYVVFVVAEGIIVAIKPRPDLTCHQVRDLRLNPTSPWDSYYFRDGVYKASEELLDSQVINEEATENTEAA